MELLRVEAWWDHWILLEGLDVSVRIVDVWITLVAHRIFLERDERGRKTVFVERNW